MTMFYLARHGQTAWNQEQRFRGRKDIPLSEQGQREAQAVAEALAPEGIDLILASPLSRAMQTLTPLANKLNRDVIPFPDLIDMDFGEWEGLMVDEARAKYPDLFGRWVSEPDTVTFPGGESLAQVQGRAMRALSHLATEHPDQKIALCSHRVVTKLIMLGLLGVKPDKFWVVRQDTACMNQFTYDPPRAVIFTMNDTRHLAGLTGKLKQDF